MAKKHTKFISSHTYMVNFQRFSTIHPSIHTYMLTFHGIFCEEKNDSQYVIITMYLFNLIMILSIPVFL